PAPVSRAEAPRDARAIPDLRGAHTRPARDDLHVGAAIGLAANRRDVPRDGSRAPLQPASRHDLNPVKNGKRPRVGLRLYFYNTLPSSHRYVPRAPSNSA